MALTHIRAVIASETSFILRHELGPIYNWEDRLADMRRGRVVSGPILLPCNLSKRASMWRPMYAPEDIEAFLIAYRAYDRRAESGVTALIHILETDDTDHRHWRVRRLSPTRVLTAHASC
jgi:hypothetical protein